MRRILVLILVILSFTYCSRKETINDVVSSLKLVSGKTDTILVSDMFYSTNYSIVPDENENLSVYYLQKSNSLILKPKENFVGLTHLRVVNNETTIDIPVIVIKEEKYKFTFRSDRKFDNVFLIGTFNGWDRSNLKMNYNKKLKLYEVDLPLEPGIYQYKYYADGEEIIDKTNPVKVPNGMGSYNSIREVKSDSENKLFLHLLSYNYTEDFVKINFFIEGINSTKNLKALLFIDNALKNEFIEQDGDKISIKIPINLMNGEKTIRTIVSENERISNLQTIKLNEGEPIKNDKFSWNDAIIYSIMIDRFNDGNPDNSIKVVHDSLYDKANYMGGDLEGIINKLDDNYFTDLGVNVLWISPVYDNPEEAFREYPAPHRYFSGYHGYWPKSANKVDEHFGSLDDLKKLISKAHKKGIKVLLDFVSNHVHQDHPYFKEHRDWFGKLELPDGRLNLRYWDEFRLTTWFEPYLPSFDYLNSDEALEVMTDNAVWWLEETGADGFRHDAVKHVPNKFWRKLNHKIKEKIQPERDLKVYQIGETFGSYDLVSSYVNNGQLDAQFNFNLYDIAIPTFVKPGENFATLNNEILKTFSVYGVQNLMGNIMDSHDKNRFMAYADGDLEIGSGDAIEIGWNNPPRVDNPENYKKLILYMAYINSIPGLPVIYYGSEFGMTGASDPDNRRMMRFDDQLSDAEKNTLKEVSKIVHLRREHSALRHGDFYTLQADQNIYAYLRSDINERVLVVLNKGNKTNIELNIPESVKIVEVVNLNDDTKIVVNNNIVNLELDKLSWNMYLLK